MSYYNLRGVVIQGDHGIWVNGVPLDSKSVSKAKSIQIILLDENGRKIEESQSYTIDQSLELKIVADSVGSIKSASGDVSGKVGTIGKISTMSGDIDIVADTVEGSVSSMSGDVTVSKGMNASSMSGKVSRK